MKIFVSGSPNSGKSGLLAEVARTISKTAKVEGFITKETKNEKGQIIGFNIKDISTKEEKVLASLEGNGPKVSNYFINTENLEAIALPALEREADLYVIDEIGEITLCSKKVEEKIEEIIKSDKNILATLDKSFIEKYKNLGEVCWLSEVKWKKVFWKIKKSLEKEIEAKPEAKQV